MLMKIFKIILTVFSSLLLIYNLSIVDFSDLFSKESTIALIGVIACICALLLMAILRVSSKINKKLNKN